MENNLVRLQKALSDAGIMSRRKAEEYIEAGRIKVNGHPAIMGMKINPKKDIVAIDSKNLDLARGKKWYIALYKPRGYVTTMNDEMGRKCVEELVRDVGVRVYPIGRLDRNSEGLLLLTNDGAFANSIMHPRYHIPKAYRVTIHPDIGDEQAMALAAGVTLDDGDKTQPAQVTVLSKEAGRAVVQITITEGKNRQIRRMCEAVHLEVARLRRISVGPVKLGMLQPGQWRELYPNEIETLRNQTRTQAQQQTAAGQVKFQEKRPAGARPGKPGRRPTGR